MSFSVKNFRKDYVPFVRATEVCQHLCFDSSVMVPSARPLALPARLKSCIYSSAGSFVIFESVCEISRVIHLQAASRTLLTFGLGITWVMLASAGTLAQMPPAVPELIRLPPLDTFDAAPGSPGVMGDVPVPQLAVPQLSADNAAQPQSSPFVRFFRDAEWYGSWGLSAEWWAPTNIHVSQPSLNNDFVVSNVKVHDEPQVTTPFGSQYNFRFGRFFNESRTFAAEINFDHTKYTSTLDQSALVSGKINGQNVDSYRVLDQNTFAYMLHNGANHLMCNLVYRRPLLGEVNQTWSVASILKVGFGMMLPHADNVVLGQSNANDVGPKSLSNAIGINSGWWRLNGWTTGIEGGFRFVLWKPVYLEVTDKIAYAELGDVPVYKGKSDLNLFMNEVVISLGVTYDGLNMRRRPN